MDAVSDEIILKFLTFLSCPNPVFFSCVFHSKKFVLASCCFQYFLADHAEDGGSVSVWITWTEVSSGTSSIIPERNLEMEKFFQLPLFVGGGNLKRSAVLVFWLFALKNGGWETTCCVNSSSLASWPERGSLVAASYLCLILLSARNSYGNNRNSAVLLAVGAA